MYVDDFKISGPVDSMEKGWALLRPKIKMDDPTDFNHVLGCTHLEGIAELKGSGKTVRTMTYDMEDFLVACVDLYKDLAGDKAKIKFASTPFIDDLHADSSVPLGDFPCLECPWCAGRFPTDSFANSQGECITKKKVIAYMPDNPARNKDSLEDVASNCAGSSRTGAGESKAASGFKTTASGGTLAIVPVKVVMKIL